MNNIKEIQAIVITSTLINNWNSLFLFNIHLFIEPPVRVYNKSSSILCVIRIKT